MLNPAIARGFEAQFKSAASVPLVEVHRSVQTADAKHTEGQPGVIVTNAKCWLQNEILHEEIFGPSTVVVACSSPAEVLACSQALDGTLTATIHGTPDDLAQNGALVDVLTRKACRLIFNGFPTGVEVGYAMHHGGPYPATTDEKFTSVGGASILSLCTSCLLPKLSRSPAPSLVTERQQPRHLAQCKRPAYEASAVTYYSNSNGKQVFG